MYTNELNPSTLTFGILFIILSLVDMIALYVIPHTVIQSNKKKYPNSTFESPDPVVVGIHFTIHILIFALGIFLIIYSCDYSLEHPEVPLILTYVASGLIFAFWIVEVVYGFKRIHYPSPIKTIEWMNTSILAKDQPIDFIFIYTQGQIPVNTCKDEEYKSRKCSPKFETCYSQRGVSVPVKSTVENYFEYLQFSDFPDMFYLNLKQDIIMNTQLTIDYSRARYNAYQCNMYDSFSKIATENYPLIEGKYIVTNGKLRAGLKKQTRIASILFGVGIYYEMYLKSIPTIDVIQKVSAEYDPNVDYYKIWKNCSFYGDCMTNHTKPIPEENLTNDL